MIKTTLTLITVLLISAASNAQFLVEQNIIGISKKKGVTVLVEDLTTGIVEETSDRLCTHYFFPGKVYEVRVTSPGYITKVYSIDLSEMKRKRIRKIQDLNVVMKKKRGSDVDQLFCGTITHKGVEYTDVLPEYLTTALVSK